MKQEPFVIERVLNAPADRVWKALTDKKQMKEWYFDVSAFKPEPGFEFQFAGCGSKGENYVHHCKVTNVIPGKLLTYTWTYENYQGESFVTFELIAEGDKTRLKLTHEGLETFPANNPDFARESFAQGWTEIIGNMLPGYVEYASITKTIEIDASKSKVWAILTDNTKVKEWANAFSEGTYIETDWQKGSQVLWKHASGDVGAKGTIITNDKDEKLQIQYYDDADAGTDATLGMYHEVYALTELGGKTILTINAGPLQQMYYSGHEPLWVNAIAGIKHAAEA